MNIKIFVFTFFCCWMSIGFSQEQKMSALDIANFQSGLRKSVKVKTLTADFTQYKKVGYVKNELVSSGKFYVKNPDRLAWIYSNPVSSAMIFNGKKMAIEEKGVKKTMDMGRSKQFEQISQAIQSNMNGGGYQGTEFSPSYFQNDKQYILKLDPIAKDVKKAMKQLVLYFDKSSYQVSEVKVEDNSNGFTRFVFRNHIANGAIADAIFEL